MVELPDVLSWACRCGGEGAEPPADTHTCELIAHYLLLATGVFLICNTQFLDPRGSSGCWTFPVFSIPSNMGRKKDWVKPRIVALGLKRPHSWSQATPLCVGSLLPNPLQDPSLCLLRTSYGLQAQFTQCDHVPA